MQNLMKVMGITLGATILIGCSQMFVVGQSDGKDAAKIEGVWKTVVTSRICATGAPVGPTFPGILLFAKGGTMAGTSTAAASVYGVWKREAGLRQFSFVTVSLRYDGNGVVLGTRRISQNITLDDSGNALTTDGDFRDFNLNGDQVLSGCSTASGARFE